MPKLVLQDIAQERWRLGYEKCFQKNRGYVVGAVATIFLLSRTALWPRRDPDLTRWAGVSRNMNRQADQYDREARSHGEKKGESPDRKRSRATAVQVSEDFGRIQTIHNEIVLAMSAGKTLDTNFIAERPRGNKQERQSA